MVTGCCGFIGSNFVRYALDSDPTVEITNLDALTYAGNPDNLADIEDNPRYQFVAGRYRRSAMVMKLVAAGNFDAIVNFAAESHVDRRSRRHSLSPPERNRYPVPLDAARAAGVPRFLQVSTDEVYGTLAPDDPEFCETTRTGAE